VNCTETRELLHGYVDGELDLMPHLEIERHLQGCPACAAAVNEQQALRTTLRDPSLAYRAPASLAARIRASLPKPNRPPVLLSWHWLAAAAALVVVALGVWSAVHALSGGSSEELLAHDVVANHVRSLMANHLLDVASSNQHVVKPWFSGQVSFAPAVKDLADQGFALAGGRLDYLDNHNVVALVYKRREHVINLFLWPAADAADRAPRRLSRQGYHLVLWTSGGFNYWAVSDLNETELQEFVQLVRQ
jgi:anti-sigma factor RsiW